MMKGQFLFYFLQINKSIFDLYQIEIYEMKRKEIFFLCFAIIIQSIICKIVQTKIQTANEFFNNAKNYGPKGKNSIDNFSQKEQQSQKRALNLQFSPHDKNNKDVLTRHQFLSDQSLDRKLPQDSSFRSKQQKRRNIFAYNPSSESSLQFSSLQDQNQRGRGRKFKRSLTKLSASLKQSDKKIKDKITKAFSRNSESNSKELNRKQTLRSKRNKPIIDSSSTKKQNFSQKRSLETKYTQSNEQLNLKKTQSLQNIVQKMKQTQLFEKLNSNKNHKKKLSEIQQKNKNLNYKKNRNNKRRSLNDDFKEQINAMVRRVLSKDTLIHKKQLLSNEIHLSNFNKQQQKGKHTEQNIESDRHQIDTKINKQNEQIIPLKNSYFVKDFYQKHRPQSVQKLSQTKFDEKNQSQFIIRKKNSLQKRQQQIEQKKLYKQRLKQLSRKSFQKSDFNTSQHIPLLKNQKFAKQQWKKQLILSDRPILTPSFQSFKHNKSFNKRQNSVNLVQNKQSFKNQKLLYIHKFAQKEFKKIARLQKQINEAVLKVLNYQTSQEQLKNVNEAKTFYQQACSLFIHLIGSKSLFLKQQNEKNRAEIGSLYEKLNYKIILVRDQAQMYVQVASIILSMKQVQEQIELQNIQDDIFVSEQDQQIKTKSPSLQHANQMKLHLEKRIHDYQQLVSENLVTGLQIIRKDFKLIQSQLQSLEDKRFQFHQMLKAQKPYPKLQFKQFDLETSILLYWFTLLLKEIQIVVKHEIFKSSRNQILQHCRYLYGEKRQIQNNMKQLRTNIQHLNLISNKQKKNLKRIRLNSQLQDKIQNKIAFQGKVYHKQSLK